MNKTTADRLKASEERYKQEQVEIKRESSIRDMLAPIQQGYEPASIHFHKLYGSHGSIHFRGTDYSSLRKADEHAPDAALLRTLLKQFEPVSLLRVRDGCTSFRPDVAAVNAELPERADVYECYGVKLRIEVFQGPKVTFQWYSYLVVTDEAANVSHPELWEFEVTLPFDRTDVGALDVVPRYIGGHSSGKISSYERCDFSAASSGQVIRWASGGKEYPNSFTVYWDRDSGEALDFAAMIKTEVKQ